MLVLHAHWLPPHTPIDSGGVLFWAETSESTPPIWHRGRLPQHPRPRPHPFCAPLQAVQMAFHQEGDERQLVLRLPTSRTGPLASPGLVHDWDLDQDSPPSLAPWIVKGVWLSSLQALSVLVSLPSLGAENGNGSPPFTLAADARYWHSAAVLALETLSAQKLVPVLVQVDEAGRNYHARWLPILDGPQDSVRLARLEAAMPAVCRAASSRNEEEPLPSPQALLTTFLHTVCDAFARRWGVNAPLGFAAWPDDPTHRWLAALFREDPTVVASPAQLQSLGASHRIWMQTLYMAGDSSFRIAFRLEAPIQQAEADLQAAQKADWQLHYLLQARDDPSLLVPADTVWKTRGSMLRHLDRRFDLPQEKLLAGLGYAARLFSPIAENLKNKRPTHLLLNSRGAYTFLREAAPLLEEAGFGLLVPPWWNKPGTRLGVRLRLKPANGQPAEGITPSGKLGLNTLVNYRWDLSLGETTLTEEEFRALAALKSPLVQIRGQWVQLDADQIEAAIQFWEKQDVQGTIGLLDALQYGLGVQTSVKGLPLDGVSSEGWVSEWLERLDRPERLTTLPQPEALHGELRPYQRYGYSWLRFLRQFGLGACLADDMGLGKTIQTIALLLDEKMVAGKEQLPPVLLVCPTSVVINWEREIQRFAPDLTTLIHQGAGRLKGEAFIEGAQKVDMVLTSYALIRQDVETLQTVQWRGVILDEAQNIKNPSTRQTQAVHQVASGFRLALTGTPVENRLSELWSIMHFLNPGYLGSHQSFRNNFALPIERYGDSEATQHLKKITAPFILRRVKSDPRVIQDLPDKLEMKVYCNLTEEQATLYEAVVQNAMKQIEEKEGIERRGQVLTMLMQLKQICNHPAQFLHQVGQEGENPLTTGIAGRSGKLERLSEMLEEILAEGDRALVFTQFAEMGQLLAGYLPKAVGRPVQFLHGGTPARSRDQMVRRFQEEEQAPPIFILSLKAGGTGLNLTRASHVFHFDRWWNPAVEDQATDRAFRIGQHRNVQVHKFITTGTLEEMIDDLIESKKGLADAVVGGGEQWLTELSTSQLRDLVALKRE